MGGEPAQVWMSTHRKGLDHHRMTGRGPAPTVCGRSTRTGVTVDAGEVAELSSKMCPRCVR